MCGPRKMREKTTSGLGWGAGWGKLVWARVSACVLEGGDGKGKPAWQGESGYVLVHETDLSFWEVGVLCVWEGSSGSFGNIDFGKVLEAA